MLNLYKLEIFAIVVQSGSFSAAAERLLLTQPAVSQHIQDLESALGARLFDRGRRGVTLTAAGETLHGYTQQILRLVAEAEAAVTDVTQLASGEMAVVATPGVSVYLLPDWVQTFRGQYPNLTVQVQTSTTPQIVAQLLSGKADIGLIEGELEAIDTAGIGVLALEEVEQFVVVGPTHPWWGRDSLVCADLHGQSFVMRQRTSQTRIWLDSRFVAAGTSVQVVAEFDNVESIKRAVERGIGISVLPAYAIAVEVEGGRLRGLPVRDKPMRRTLKLLWNEEGYPTPVCRAFVRHLAAYFPQLQESAFRFLAAAPDP
ncbi:MAG: LysR family transcriptional regulator [Caldilineaceae bacterium]|nr:LysR family transcriptional regulator [Caldilineaceae bacterium]